MPQDQTLTHDEARRRRGVFLTPLPFAQKALDLLSQTFGNDWQQTGNYRLWDMAAGTGNLEYFLPKDFLKYCFLSTLEQNDVEHLKQTFPEAAVFQYDYLRDDAEQVFTHYASASTCAPNEKVSKMPESLQNDLANPAIKWIVLVNPPYATAQEAGLKGNSKEGVADTIIRKRMHVENLGEVSRELYVQFLYRIAHEFKHREAILGLFAPLKYLLSSNYQKFRDNVFKADFKSGFIFSSENFGGTSRSSHFPVSFILWNLSQSSVSGQKIQLDVLDSTAQKMGTKTVQSVHRRDFLSQWIQRPRGTKIFPPFGSALVIKAGNVDIRNRIAEGFLASLMCPGNELQNQQQTAFLSGPQASAGALSVTPDNFEHAVVVFAARRLPQDSWVNHVDQLLRPNRTLSQQFISDCAVWSLFDTKNQTVALRNVKYQNRVYQITNHFFPFCVSEVGTWEISDSTIRDSLAGASNSYVADWFSRQTFSTEAQKVFASGREIYRHYFAHLHLLHKAEFGIETYDAGWHQIRKALQKGEFESDIKMHQESLKEKLLLQLYDYGICRFT